MASIIPCPHAQHSLWRAAVRSVARTRPTSICRSSPPSRWLSCSSIQHRPSPWPRASCHARSSTRHAILAQSRPFFSGPGIVRDYEELPRDYRDKVGLPFRSRDLTEEEVERIFGPEFGAVSANHLLRILHGRRVAGTLDDPAFAAHTAQFSDEQILKALEYLRKTVAVNEVVNAGLRAEDELAEMELDAERREVVKTAATKKGIRDIEDAQDAENTKEGEEATDTVKSFQPDPVYGRSSFDEIRARNQAKARVEDRARKEEEEARKASGTEEVRTGTLTKFRDPNRQIQNPAVAKFYKEAESDMQEAPQMSSWERIGPSAVAAVLVVGFLAAVAMVYEEPQAKYRLLPELTTAQATVGTIVALNVLVYLGWRIPPLWKAFNKYMLFVVGAPRPLALFTAPFSHKELGHLLVNMVPLYVVGTHLHEDVGRAGFTALYVACGAFGFLGTLTTYTLANMLGVYTLGASGATMGLMAAYFWEHRGDAFRILGLPPDGVQGIVWLALLVGVHLAGVGGMFSAKNKIDMASHLAGLVTGIVGIELIQGSKRRESVGNSGETEGKTDAEATQIAVVKDLFSGQVIEQKEKK